MVRIQLHLTAAQDRALRSLAARRGLTRAELIRRGIDRILAEEVQGGDPLLDLVAQAGPGPTKDGAEHHDAYLYGAPEEHRHLTAAEPPPRLRK